MVCSDKGDRRPSQVLCGPAAPILAEIHQPCAPRDPRTLATVQGVTRHFEQNQRRRRAPLAMGARYHLSPPYLPLINSVNRG